MKDLEFYDPRFYGTENYYRCMFGSMVYTDSIAHLCEEKKCYWLLDMVNSYYPQFRKHDFLVITLVVEDESAVFEIRTDSGTTPIIRQEIPYTDLEVNIKFFYSNNVLMFPSDY